MKFIKTDKQKPEDVLNKYEKYLLDNILKAKMKFLYLSLKMLQVFQGKQNENRSGSAKISLGKNQQIKAYFRKSFYSSKKLKGGNLS